jgi:hypothetical protein
MSSLQKKETGGDTGGRIQFFRARGTGTSNGFHLFCPDGTILKLITKIKIKTKNRLLGFFV